MRMVISYRESGGVAMARFRSAIDAIVSRTARLLGCALLVLVGFGLRPLLAQAASPDAQTEQARSAEFHARIRELAGRLADAPLLKGLSAEEREKRVEFVGANMIFVLTHELSHASRAGQRVEGLVSERPAGQEGGGGSRLLDGTASTSSAPIGSFA
jgi:hypothetical protein